MNLIPLNRICRALSGDVATLPSWANMSSLHLMPHEDLLVSSEDVRCFFYIFRVPSEWHPFLAFNCPVPESLCGNRPGKHYLCSTVLPMGFKNSVSIAQHIHRVVTRRAIRSSRLTIGSEAEIRKDRPFPSGDHFFRIYLDNFDELRKVNKTLAEAIEGKVSALTLGLREEYLRTSIPRHPKRALPTHESPKFREPSLMAPGVRSTQSRKRWSSTANWPATCCTGKAVLSGRHKWWAEALCIWPCSRDLSWEASMLCGPL